MLRVPSSIAFLSLLIGQLLTNEASVEVYNLVAALTPIGQLRDVQVILLLLPLLLTILFLKGRIPKSKLAIEALPTLFVVGLCVVLLSPVIQELKIFVDMATDDQADTYNTIIVIAASVSGLLSAWFSYPRPAHDKHHKHK